MRGGRCRLRYPNCETCDCQSTEDDTTAPQVVLACHLGQFRGGVVGLHEGSGPGVATTGLVTHLSDRRLDFKRSRLRIQRLQIGKCLLNCRNITD